MDLAVCVTRKAGLHKLRIKRKTVNNEKLQNNMLQYIFWVFSLLYSGVDYVQALYDKLEIMRACFFNHS